MPMSMEDRPDMGRLKVSITNEITSYPITTAKVSISYPGVPDSIFEELETDSSGQTEEIELPAPPIEYSLDIDNNNMPYAE